MRHPVLRSYLEVTILQLANHHALLTTAPNTILILIPLPFSQPFLVLPLSLATVSASHRTTTIFFV